MSEGRKAIIKQQQRYKNVYIELKFGEHWSYERRKKRLKK